MSITFVYDAIHQNIPSLPKGMLAALYTTGSPDIKATPQDFVNHSNAIHICQDSGSDDTADIIDMEAGAASPLDCANWIPRARASFNSVRRAGQRWPGIYASLNSLTPVANALVTAKLSNVPLWVAHWGIDQTVAIADIVNATQPFPIVGMQIANLIVDDFSVFSTSYVNLQSHAINAKPQMPPGQWDNPSAWTWRECLEVGLGLDDNVHAFLFHSASGQWTLLT